MPKLGVPTTPGPDHPFVQSLSGRTDVLKELVKEMLTKIIPQMQEKVQGSMVNVQAVNTRAEGVTTCLKKAGPNVLEANDIKHIISTVTTLVTESFERRAEYSLVQDYSDKGKGEIKTKNQRLNMKHSPDPVTRLRSDPACVDPKNLNGSTMPPTPICSFVHSFACSVAGALVAKIFRRRGNFGDAEILGKKVWDVAIVFVKNHKNRSYPRDV